MAKEKRKTDLTPVLRLKVTGPGIRKGRVPIPELVQLCREAQKAINKQAEVLKRKKTLHPGPTARSIQEECTLELIGITGNSPTVLEFDFRKPQRAMDFHEEFGQKALTAVGETINGVRRANSHEFDPGVLYRLYELTGAITPKGIAKIEWMTTAGANGHRKWVTASITKLVRQKVARRLSGSRTAIAEVDGVMEMADFKKEDFKCRIDSPVAPPVECTFDPSRADEVYRLLRKHVHVTGRATIKPYTEKIETLHIETISPLSPTSLSDESFFADVSLSELMDANNAKPISDPSVMAGGIPADEDLDVMLSTLYDARK